MDKIKLKREVERSKEVNTLKGLLDEKMNENNQKLIDRKISEIIDNSAVLFSGDIVYDVITQKKLSKQQVVQIQNTIMNVFKVKIDRIRITSAASQ
ncbi:hypothetical protein [Caldicellulosiruptor morganii]|uniref:SpoIIIAH-like family protein n=1 Tax=Caldicellulosiruptor morganii TaxID=1387555 RepID=A0ABY7BPJ0_9FIRM|nr:hypothetical protein [Caldicellulosiruptor morganii]WAM34743.1 SpoIIIAH-like family protein [Caldicellulosiruptor morganii]